MPTTDTPDLQQSAKEKLLFSFFRFLTVLSPVWNTRFTYRYRFGRKLDLNHPETMNEKNQWLKLNSYMKDPLVIQCADKVAVREYVERIGCRELLNDLYGVWSDFSEIDWDSLPDQFAMKWNFGCGMNLICPDKSQLDYSETKELFDRWKTQKCWLPFSEMQYKPIPKKILCERYLNDGTGLLPTDYKILCFHGRPMYIMICLDREKGHGQTLYYWFDRNWEFVPIYPDLPYDPAVRPVPRPPYLEEMFDYAEKLSSPFPFVRVDLYAVGGRLYFGELTFTPTAALDTEIPREMDLELGRLIHLPTDL